MAITFDELLSPSTIVRLVFVSAKKLKDKEIIIIMVIIDKKKAIDLIKTLKKIDIFSDL